MSVDFYIPSSEKTISQRRLETYRQYNKIVQWGRRDPIGFCRRVFGIELLDYQKFAIANTWTAGFAAWLQSRNAGKSEKLDTRIPTPDGDKILADIHPGDYVFSEEGKPIKVLAESPIYVGRPCYEVSFSDGEKIVCDENHLWTVKTRNSSKVKHNVYLLDGHFVERDAKGFATLPTKELAKHYATPRKDGKGTDYLYRVELPSAVEYAEQKLPVPPYLLGVWLGDGCHTSNAITSGAQDVEEMCSLLDAIGVEYIVSKNKGRTAYTIHIHPSDFDGSGEKKCFTTLLRELGVYGNKHIPQQYLYNSVEQRLELLRGLMDTDGHCDSFGRCEFAQKRDELTKEFCWLLTSLGISYAEHTRTTKCLGKEFESHRVFFDCGDKHTVFKLKRKAERQRKRHKRGDYKTIVEIKPVPSVPTKCISVANPRGLYLCGEHNTVTHNSSLAAIYTMLRSVMFPGHQAYFISNVGAQAKETFLKMEHIAKQEISTFANCTDVFLQEVERGNAASDGFVHLSEGFKTKLFNGSEIFTLNSDPTNVKGRRAHEVYVDEAGWVTEELMMQVEQFANQNENFKLGAGFDAKCEPKEFPRQLIYGSSASDTDTAFYKKVREYTKQMLKGDTRYFVCDFTIDAVMAATVNGEAIAEPLISQAKIDQAVLLAPDKAQRELWNHFSNESHEGQILTSREIMQHTSNFLPVLSNPDGSHMYMFSWDSARINDNSVIEVAELIDDPKIGWKMRLVNVHNLVDVDNRRKTPLTLPEQVKEFKKLLLAYNGNVHGKLDYENIKAIVCDSGAAGQMIGGVTDYLLEEWVDDDNIKHKGLIDKNHKSSQAARVRYPDAVDIIRLIDPKSHRNELLQAISDMVKLGVVEFPVDYDVSKDYITFIEEDGTETRHDLTLDEQVALAQIDLTKTEIVTMCKYTNAGNITFNFPPELRNKMHDDRVFAFGLLCYQLSLLRRKQVTHKPQKAETIMSMPTLATPISFDDGFDY